MSSSHEYSSANKPHRKSSKLYPDYKYRLLEPIIKASVSSFSDVIPQVTLREDIRLRGINFALIVKIFCTLIKDNIDSKPKNRN